MEKYFVALGSIFTVYYSIRSIVIHWEQKPDEYGKLFFIFNGIISYVWADLLASTVGWFSLYYFIKYFKLIEISMIRLEQITFLGILFMIGFLGVTGHLKDILTEIKIIKDLLNRENDKKG